MIMVEKFRNEEIELKDEMYAFRLYDSERDEFRKGEVKVSVDQDGSYEFDWSGMAQEFSGNGIPPRSFSRKSRIYLAEDTKCLMDNIEFTDDRWKLKISI